MIKFIRTVTLFALIILVPASAFADDPADDMIIGTVRLKPNLKLDAQARKEIAAAAAKIKKVKGGTVKLRGNYPAASTEEEFLSKSVFMAREVEQYMKNLLPAKQKIYIMFSPFSDEKKNGECVVEIFLYPHELKAADFEGFRVNTVEGKPVVQQISGKQAEPQVPVEQVPVQAAGEGKSMSPAAAKPERPAEDARRAEELVRRAKERAAKRAKRKDDAE